MTISVTNLTGALGEVDVINNNGQILFSNITNNSNTTANNFQSTLYIQTGSNVTDIGTYAGVINAAHVNDSGQVSFQVLPGTSTETLESYVWESGSATELPLISGLYSPYAWDIDDQGRVYGESQYSPGGLSPGNPPDWVYQNGTVSILPSNVSLTEGVSLPMQIQAGNANGDLAGSGTFSLGANVPLHLLLWKDGNIIDCGTISSNFVGVAVSAVNLSDQIAGFEVTTNGLGPRTAFISQNQTITALPSAGSAYVVSEAQALNDQGIVVGDIATGFDSTSISKAVVWQDGNLIDLNTLLPANSGWVLLKAVDINDSNVIVGIGTYNGVESNFELTFTPETFAAAAAVSQYALGEIYSITPISDTAVNVSTNLDGLESIAAAGHLGAITLTDTGTPDITLTATQLTSDAAVLRDILGSYTVTVTGVAAVQAGAEAALTGVTTVQVTDSAANVASNLDSLEALATAGKLSISLTDSGVPTVTVSASQVTSDAAALRAITGNFNVDVTAPSTSATIVGGTAGLGTTVMFGRASSSFTIASSGDGHSFTVSDGSISYSLKNVNAIEFSDVTDIVASQTPPAAGAVSSAQITELYSAVLGRIPDVGGLAFYQNYASANPSTPFLQYAEWFLSSAEYTSSLAHNYAQTVAGDEQFITDSYNNLLHRSPTAAEVAYYETNVIAPALVNQTPGTAAYAAADKQAHAQTLVYFSQSPEFLGDVTVTAQNASSSSHWLVLI